MPKEGFNIIKNFLSDKILKKNSSSFVNYCKHVYVLNRLNKFYPLLSTNCFLCLVKCLNTDEKLFYIV